MTLLQCPLRLFFATVLIAGANPLPAQDAPDPQEGFRESVALETRGSVVRRLATVREYLAAEEWAEAIQIVEQIAETHGETLIQVEPGRYVNVRRYCNLLLAALPAEGLTVYRGKVDPRARQWFEAGKNGRDEAALRRVVRQAFAATYGDDALFLLGELAWGRGETATARNYWEQLLPLEQETPVGQPLPVLRYPDSDYHPAEILARLVLCSLMEGNFPRAELEREAFERLHPEAEGHLAGREGNLAEILESVAAEARQWESPARDDEISTFAMNARRNQVLPRPADAVGAPQWSIRLPDNRVPSEERRPALRDRGPLSYHPVVFRDLVLVNDAHRISAWNLRTGQPAWPRREDDPGLSVEEQAVIYPPVPELKPLVPDRPVGVPRFTMTLHEGRLYAKMGTPVTGRAKNELRDLPSDLVCLDLARGEGKLLWKVSAADTADDENGWAFEGSPVVDGERVYIALRRSHPQTQINVACFEAENGRLIWNRRVCAAVTRLGERQNFISHQLLTLADDTLFYSTDLGAIAALNTGDGRLQWVVTYESREPENHGLLSDHTKQGLTPCLFHQGLLVAAPSDSDDLMVLDANNGRLWWRKSLRGGVRHLLGVGQGKLIVSGDRLWGLDLQSGEVDWELGFEDPAGYGYGRGLLAGDVVYWPTREEIFVLDQATGTLRRRMPLKTLHGETGGNLTMTGQFLLVAQPDRLVVFGESGLPKVPMRPEVSVLRRYESREVGGWP